MTSDATPEDTRETLLNEMARLLRANRAMDARVAELERELKAKDADYTGVCLEYADLSDENARLKQEVEINRIVLDAKDKTIAELRKELESSIPAAVEKTSTQLPSEVPWMDVAEFRSLGFLQECNRLFFHPRGMALAVCEDDNGKQSIAGIWDYRNDPEGVAFETLDDDESRRNRETSQAEYERHVDARVALFGDPIQQVPEATAAAVA